MSHAGEGGTGERGGVGGRGAGEAGFGGGGGGTRGGVGDLGGDGRDLGSTAAQRRGIGETAAQRGGEFGAFAGEEQESSVVRKIKDFFTPTRIGGIVGAVAGPIAFGVSPAVGAKGGAFVGGLVEKAREEELGAPTVAQTAPSVTPQDISAQRQFTSPQLQQLGGDGRQVAAVPPPVSRESGIQQPQPQLAALGQGLPQQRFLTPGILPTVNLGAFPGALGRV